MAEFAKTFLEYRESRVLIFLFLLAAIITLPNRAVQVLNLLFGIEAYGMLSI